MKIKYIFFISTPFHLKVAETISKDLKSVVFIIFRRSNHIQSSDIHTTIYIDLNGIKIPILKQFEVVKKIDAILNKIKFEDAIDLYYPNDYGTEFQYSLSYFKKSDYIYKLNMFEDGIGSYTDRKCFTLLDGAILKRVKVYLFKILLRGRFTNTIGIRATVADEYYGFSHKAFFEEQKIYEKKFHLLAPNIFTDIPISNKIPKNMHLLLTNCMVEDGLIDMSSWIDIISDVAADIAKKTDTIYVKSHPRESKKTIDELKVVFRPLFQEIIYLKANETIEEYLSTIENREDLTLYASFSSALFYSKLFFPKIEIISLPLSGLNNPYLECTSSSYNNILEDLIKDIE